VAFYFNIGNFPIIPQDFSYRKYRYMICPPGLQLVFNYADRAIILVLFL